MTLSNRLLKTSLFIFTFIMCSQAVAEITSERKNQLIHLLKHDCGSCHGMTLKGGLGPSLLPESLKNKPDELLFVTIREGRKGTPMPPWKSQLSEDDVLWIISQLRNGVAQ